jgi:hypothetical protein
LAVEAAALSITKPVGVPRLFSLATMRDTVFISFGVKKNGMPLSRTALANRAGP